MESSPERTSEGITPRQWERVDEVLERHRGRPGGLIPALAEVQEITGFLPESVQRRVATGLGQPLARVYGVVTFYSFFTMRPRGRQVIRVCTGTACHVRGAAENLDRLEELLGIEPGGCTADRAFGLEVVRCLGACGLAPVMTVGGEPYRRVRRVRIPEILRSRRSEPAGEADHSVEDEG